MVNLGKREALLILVVLTILISSVIVWLLYFGGLEILGFSPKIDVDEILHRSTKALENIVSYKFNIVINTVVKMKGVTTSITIEGNGVVDLKHRKMRMEYTFQNVKQISYIINDAMYLRIYGKWYKTSQPGLWKTQEMIGSSLDIMSRFKKKFGGFEKIDGRDIYRIELSSEGLSEEELTRIMLNITHRLMGYMDLGNITIKKYSGDIWIEKETYFLFKSKSHIEMVVETKMGVAETTVDVVYTIFNYNKPVNIYLPPEAKNAKPLEYITPTL